MWRTWFWSKRRRQAALEEAAAANAREQRAARRRVLEQATVLMPVMATRRAPLLTRGQSARAARGNR
jgi:hypothetical protein